MASASLTCPCGAKYECAGTEGMIHLETDRWQKRHEGHVKPAADVTLLWDSEHMRTCHQCRGMIRPEGLEPDVPVPGRLVSIDNQLIYVMALGRVSYYDPHLVQVNL